MPVTLRGRVCHPCAYGQGRPEWLDHRRVLFLGIYLACYVVKWLPKFLGRLLYEFQVFLYFGQTLADNVYGLVVVPNRAAGKIFDRGVERGGYADCLVQPWEDLL